MSLAPGVRLGAYEVLGLIGAGGMGEVYRARDTRLDRTVAIKVLLEPFAADPARQQRFEREARAVAALNHPHICHLHDVGEDRGIEFLVMEYLEGQTLEDRLVRGPLPPDEALRYAVEIADALDHAHRRGLVHRDLKPGNVMLTKSGTKLLDFGLSKAHAQPDLIAMSTIPTAGAPLTAEGAVLGTFPYMAPEQLGGRDADARSDIFAFGAVLYEMTTGRRAFEGTTAATLIGAILHTDPPPLSTLQPLVPPPLDRLVTRCLAKDPDDRWQTARDLMLELKWVADSKADGPITGVIASVRASSRERVAWLLSGVLLTSLVVGAAVSVAYFRAPRSDESAQRLSLLLPPTIKPADLSDGGGPVISPDGRQLVFAGTGPDGRKLLWIRPLDSLEARPLSATEGGNYPFWSPDSRFIGFFAQGKLKTMAIDGGPSQIICDAVQPRGGAWNGDGVIVYSANVGERLYRVAAAGGSPTPLKIDGPNTESYWPFFLPDGRHFLFFGRPEKPGIYAASLDSKEATLVLGEHVGVGYASGYLLALAGSARGSDSVGRTLMARPFDTASLQITGEGSVLAEHVTYETLPARGAFSVSRNGTLLYKSGQTLATELIWFDRTGNQLAMLAGSAGYVRPSLSPDGKHVAVERTDPQVETTDVWLIETMRGVGYRLTVDPAPDWYPIWSPDGRRVVFTSPRGTPPNLYQQDASRPGPGELLLKGTRVLHPGDWSSDGQFLVYAALDTKTQWDLWILPMGPGAAGPDRTPTPFLNTDFIEHYPQFSPDGHWMAYASDESGTWEVYVRPFPRVEGGRLRISSNGGTQPRWRRDGKELFYVAPDGSLMAATITAAPAFEAGVPKALFKTRMAQIGNFGTNYTVAADGARFLISSITEAPQPSSITVVLDWPAAIRR